MKIKQNLEISDQTDRDGEIELLIEECENDCSTWINKKESIGIVQHLIKVFDLKSEEIIL